MGSLRRVDDTRWEIDMEIILRRREPRRRRGTTGFDATLKTNENPLPVVRIDLFLLTKSSRFIIGGKMGWDGFCEFDAGTLRGAQTRR